MTKRSVVTVLAVLGILAIGAGSALHAEATFTPFSSPDLVPADISADGTVVTGNGSFGGSVFVWTEAGGFDFIGGQGAKSISRDGSAVCGDTIGDSLLNEAGRWTEPGGWEALGGLPGAQGVDANLSNGYDCSTDGSVVSGLAWDLNADPIAVGFIYDDVNGIVSLGSSGNASRGSVINADGTIIAGFDEHPSFGNRRPARWTEATGWENLSDDPDNVAGEALCINGTGDIIGGSSTNLVTFNPEAFIWKEGQGLVNLGVLDPNQFLPSSDAFAISDDGSVAVGWSGSFFDFTGFDAFVWTEAMGMRKLLDVLVEQGATGLDGWDLDQATGISADGKTVIGYGIDPDTFLLTGFIATLDFGGGPQISQTGTCPGAKTFSATGMTPDGPVGFVIGTAAGSLTVPNGACAGTELGIAEVLTRFVMTADGDGNASTPTVIVPSVACGRPIQTIDRVTCEVSNVLDIE